MTMNACLVRKHGYTPAQRRRTTMVLDGQRMGDERDWVLVGFFVTCSSSAEKRFIRPAKQDEMGLWLLPDVIRFDSFDDSFDSFDDSFDSFDSIHSIHSIRFIRFDSIHSIRFIRFVIHFRGFYQSPGCWAIFQRCARCLRASLMNRVNLVL